MLAERLNDSIGISGVAYSTKHFFRDYLANSSRRPPLECDTYHVHRLIEFRTRGPVRLGKSSCANFKELCREHAG